LIVELDGGQHGSEYDKRRDSYLARQGWRVLRFWNPDMLSNTEGVLEMIRLALLEQQERMQPPSPSRR
jgi:very-short-patch-repair endonuclease